MKAPTFLWWIHSQGGVTLQFTQQLVQVAEEMHGVTCYLCNLSRHISVVARNVARSRQKIGKVPPLASTLHSRGQNPRCQTTSRENPHKRIQSVFKISEKPQEKFLSNGNFVC